MTKKNSKVVGMSQDQLKVILLRLGNICSASNGGHDEVLSCDLLYQDALFRVQDELAVLMLYVAKALGPEEVDKLVQRFPYAYRQTYRFKEEATE